jgi:hypothetical protein
MSGIIGGAGSKSGVIGTTELDYEEGFYTYALPFTSSGSVTPRAGYTLLKYIKIGRVCHVFGKIEVSGESSPSGQMKLTLPFTAGANDNTAGDHCASGMTAHFRSHGATFEDAFMDIISGGAAGVFYRMDHDGTRNSITDGNVDSSFELYLNISYHTAT